MTNKNTDKAKGRVKEATGAVTGNTRLKNEGRADHAKGSTKNAVDKTLSSTNPIESMIEIVRHTQRNVKRWQDGDMRKRWTAAGMLQAEQQFRRVIGYTDLAKLVIAIERRHLTLESQNLTPRPEEVTITKDAAQLATV